MQNFSFNQADLNTISLEKLSALNGATRGNIFYEEWIDSLDCSREMKDMLKTICEITRKIAGELIRFGKIVLDLIIRFAKNYPYAATGALIGAILSVLVSSIPVIGGLLSPIVTPILIAVPAALGFLKDYQDGNDFDIVTEIKSMFG